MSKLTELCDAIIEPNEMQYGLGYPTAVKLARAAKVMDQYLKEFESMYLDAKHHNTLTAKEALAEVEKILSEE